MKATSVYILLLIALICACFTLVESSSNCSTICIDPFPTFDPFSAPTISCNCTYPSLLQAVDALGNVSALTSTTIYFSGGNHTGILNAGINFSNVSHVSFVARDVVPTYIMCDGNFGWAFENTTSIQIIGLNFQGCFSTNPGAALAFISSTDILVAYGSFVENELRSLADCATDQACYEAAVLGTGGAISLFAVTDCLLTNITFSRNAAKGDVVYAYVGNGGGVGMVNSVNVTVNSCNFVDNHAFTWGGGLAMWHTSAVISGCTFASNLAEWQGGAMAAVSGSSFTVVGSLFTENFIIPEMQYGEGGAIFVQDTDGCRFFSSVFQYNSVAATGGAVSIRGGRLTYSTFRVRFRDCKFVGNSARAFGGAVASFGNTHYDDCEFYNHTSASIGGALFVDAASVVLSSSTLSGNYASNRGGAISLSGWTADVSLSQIVAFNGNVAGMSGGAIFCGDGAWAYSLVGSHVTFNQNSVSTGQGGAVYLTTFSGFVVQSKANVLMSDNWAFLDGGAVFGSNGAEVRVDGNLTLTRNSAINGLGGALVASPFTALSASLSAGVGHISVINNSAYSGGGIAFGDVDADFLDVDSAPILNMEVSDNHAAAVGGGIVFYGGLPPGSSDPTPWLRKVARNVLLKGNFAPYTTNNGTEDWAKAGFGFQLCDGESLSIYENSKLSFVAGTGASFEVCMVDLDGKLASFAGKANIIGNFPEGLQIYPPVIAASITNGVGAFLGVTAYPAGLSFNITFQLQTEALATALVSQIEVSKLDLFVEVTPCPAGRFIQAGAPPRCTRCFSGFYSLEPSQFHCNQCPPPEDAVCTPSDVLSLRDRWVRKANGIAHVYSCPPSTCDENNTCFPNRLIDSPLCSRCVDGYSYWNAECVPCTDVVNIPLIFVVFFTILVALIIIHLASTYAIGFMTMFFYYTLTCSMVIPPSGVLDGEYTTLTALSAKPFAFIPHSCLFQREGVGLFFSELLFPLVVYFILLLIASVNFILAKFVPRSKIPFAARNYFRTFVVLAIAFHQAISISLFAVLNTVDVGSERIVFGYPYLDAKSRAYSSIFTLSIILVIVITYGVPVVIAGLCYYHWKHGFAPDSALQSLFGRFRRERPFGAFFLILRRSALVTVNFILLRTFPLENNVRLGSLLIFHCLVLLLHERMLEFTKPIMNTTDTVSLVAVCFVIFASMQYSPRNNTGGWFISLCFWSFLGIMVILGFSQMGRRARKIWNRVSMTLGLSRSRRFSNDSRDVLHERLLIEMAASEHASSENVLLSEAEPKRLHDTQ